MFGCALGRILPFQLAPLAAAFLSGLFLIKQPRTPPTRRTRKIPPAPAIRAPSCGQNQKRTFFCTQYRFRFTTVPQPAVFHKGQKRSRGDQQI